MIQERHCQAGLQVLLPLRDDPINADHGLLGDVFVLAHGKLADHRLRLLEQWLSHDLGVNLDLVELGQELVQKLQTVVRRVVAVKPELGVGRMVELAMEVLEVVKGQVRDLPRVTAGVHAVLCVREHGHVGEATVRGIWVRVDPLHLIEHDALVLQRLVLLLHLIVPSLLGKHPGVADGTGMEDSIQVDIDKVVEVLEIAAGHWVAGSVRKSHSIQEGLQT
mmetsp:Transcript_26248/g.62601  ORF Transcript_26248/g.62601 Transcript_26248/m.62601 type:complete len:221 (+) Transcript_26248:1086-1748(+)